MFKHTFPNSFLEYVFYPMLREVSSLLSLLVKSSWWCVALSVSVGDSDWLFGYLVPVLPSPVMIGKKWFILNGPLKMQAKKKKI